MCTVMLVISFEQKEASVNLLLPDLNFHTSMTVMCTTCSINKLRILPHMWAYMFCMNLTINARCLLYNTLLTFINVMEFLT